MATEVSGPWTKVFSAEHKTYYYYNSQTQQSTWTQPADWNPQPVGAAYGAQGGAAAGGASNGSPKCFVGGLSFDTDERSLGQLCSQVGRVVEVHIPKDRDSGRSKGFGFVTFSSAAEASRAISELNNQTLDGRSIRFDTADKKGSSASNRDSPRSYRANDSPHANESGRRRSRSRSRDRDERQSSSRSDLQDIRGKAAEDKGFSQKTFEGSSSIYVCGLPDGITMDAVVKAFSVIGVIKQKKVGKNRWDLAPKVKLQKGSAVIFYEDPSSAAAAPKFFHNEEVDFGTFGSHKVTCEVNAKQAAPPPSADGGYGGRGGRGGYRGGGGGGGYRGGGGGGGGGRGNVRPGDWPCPSCNANNFASKTACFKCRTPKPSGGSRGGGGGYDRRRY